MHIMGGQTFLWNYFFCALLIVLHSTSRIQVNSQPCTLSNEIPFSVCADPPEITIRPRNLQVRANGIAAFYCAARGDPVPNIQWRKNGKRVSSKFYFCTSYMHYLQFSSNLSCSDSRWRNHADYLVYKPYSLSVNS